MCQRYPDANERPNNTTSSDWEEVMKSAAFVSASLMAGVLVFGIGGAYAQQKLVLKASDVHPAGYPTVAAVESMGKKLEQVSNGRLSIAMYPSMQLGGEK